MIRTLKGHYQSLQRLWYFDCSLFVWLWSSSSCFYSYSSRIETILEAETYFLGDHLRLVILSMISQRHCSTPSLTSPLANFSFFDFETTSLIKNSKLQLSNRLRLTMVRECIWQRQSIFPKPSVRSERAFLTFSLSWSTVSLLGSCVFMKPLSSETS